MSVLKRDRLTLDYVDISGVSLLKFHHMRAAPVRRTIAGVDLPLSCKHHILEMIFYNKIYNGTSGETTVRCVALKASL